jgi:leader peptidase (prepilin peptidase)/N-methyltransferase
VDFLFSELLWLRALIGAGLGLVVGSFVATAALRWPKGEGVARGRSRCDGCGAALGPLELVPLLSYALQRGRCRRCGARIDARHPAIEGAAALLGAVAAAAHPGALGLVTALFGWWLLLIAILDLEHQWLPDRLTLPLGALGLAAAWAGFGPPLLERAAGAAIGWGALVLIAEGYKRLRGREGMGGGDPRLLGALGAWVGAWQLPAILLGAGLVGLAAVLAMRLRGRRVDGATRLPLGSLMALAAWPVWLVSAGATIQPSSIIPGL